MRAASCGFVAKTTSSGTSASRHRSRSCVQLLGRYSSRSTSVWPALLAYAKKTPIWQFSTRPAYHLTISGREKLIRWENPFCSEREGSACEGAIEDRHAERVQREH